MTEKLLVANWKSHKIWSEAQLWFKTFFNQKTVQLLSKKQLKMVVAPPFVFLESAQRLLKQGINISKITTRNIFLSTQDLSSYPAGSYTGAVSALNLNEFLVDYVIIGHSERRRYFHETDNDVALKVEQALENNLIPIVCVNNKTITSQASKLDEKIWKKCVIAYEPQGAIGTGLAADINQVKLAFRRIKQAFGQVRVLYGGSVNELDINNYLAISDGVLVGSKSLDPNDWTTLIKTVNTSPKLT